MKQTLEKREIIEFIGPGSDGSSGDKIAIDLKYDCINSKTTYCDRSMVRSCYLLPAGNNAEWERCEDQVDLFYYTEVDPENRPPIEAKAKELIIDAGFKVGLAHCAIECKPKVK